MHCISGGNIRLGASLLAFEKDFRHPLSPNPIGLFVYLSQGEAGASTIYSGSWRGISIVLGEIEQRASGAGEHKVRSPRLRA